MALTPLDIQHKEFPRKAFRGYDPDAVDQFLNEVIEEFERLIRENSELRHRLEAMDEKLQQYRKLEETLQKTLVAAQEAAEEMKANARKEADLIVEQARLEAQRIVSSAHAKVRETLEANADLFQACQTLRMQVRSLLAAQLQAIDQLPDPLSSEKARVALEELPGTKNSAAALE
ncbi:MAG TPA: DivIVA domain-containing protein [Symbiobacteriaceae bacterium]